MSKVILFCGLPGSGKTTLAKKLAAESRAVRLCPDDWMADLGLDLFDEVIRTKLEIRLWDLAKELVTAGQDVILENGLWTKPERDAKLRDIRSLGAASELHFMDVPLEELWRRLQIRNGAGGHGTVPLCREQIERYAALFEKPTAVELALHDRAMVHVAS